MTTLGMAVGATDHGAIQIVDSYMGQERVLESHQCGDWELVGQWVEPLPNARYRCGRVFGDGVRCDRSVLTRAGWPVVMTNRRIYLREAA